MNDFNLDPDLHESLKAIRDSVRQLFDQLRLQHENGDMPGRDRLERVPALAKHNFGNLTGEKPHLAAKEAWRLVDFLEGSEPARLTSSAREALRMVELDKKLAALRASDQWMEAAARLRHALGAGPNERETDPAPVLAAERARSDSVSPLSEGIQEPKAGSGPAERGPPNGSGFRRSVLIGITGLVAVTILVAAWWLGRPSHPLHACLALEGASKSTLESHRAPWPGTPLPRPPRTETGARIVTISDSQGGPVRSTWTTSQYSHAEGNAPKTPGGGRSDYRLQVGGWGDTYLSLLHVPVPSDRLAHRAVIQLTVVGGEVDSRPTSMTLRNILDDWRVSPGPNNRLWWRDCPRSEAIANHLPPPGPRGSVYEIDITDLYNLWAAGSRQPYGIMLEPEQIGSWGPGKPHYANFSTFYSTRARDLDNRPRLVLTY